MKIFLLTLYISLISGTVFSQWPSSVNQVEAKPNQTVSIRGDFSSGVVIQDLSWASRSSTACFPATQNLKFRANMYFLEPHSYPTLSWKLRLFLIINLKT